MNIDWDTGLDKLLTREIFWKTVFSWGILICATLIFDSIIGFFTLSGSVAIFPIMFIGLHGFGMIVKRQKQRKAERLNDLDIDESDISDLEELAEKYDYPIISKRDLEAVKDASGEEIEWRDLWL